MTASMTYDDQSIPGVEGRIVLDVRLAGRTLIHRRVSSASHPADLVPPLPSGPNPDQPPVVIRDLDGDGIPQAIFTLRGGSAAFTPITFMSSGSTLAEHQWFDSTYRIHDLGRDGVPEITTNQHFDYIRAPLAPMQVLRIVGAQLVDVTRTPAGRPAVLADARRQLQYRPWRENPSGLASSAADQCSLGRCTRGYELIRRVISRHPTPYLRRFLRHVRAELRRYGYDQT
jgi:hypothetical protein